MTVIEVMIIMVVACVVGGVVGSTIGGQPLDTAAERALLLPDARATILTGTRDHVRVESSGRLGLVRWLLVPVASLSGFFVGLVVGAGAQDFVRDSCPWGLQGDGDSQWCPVPVWVTAVLYSGSAALAAVLVVFLGCATAPVRTRWLPWTIYGFGAAFAIVIGVSGVSAPHFEQAIVGTALADELAARCVAQSIVPAGCSLLAGAFVAGACARDVGPT